MYFDDEDSDSPNGVVVLDSSTDIESLDTYDGRKFVIRVSPNIHDSEARSFYFQVRSVPGRQRCVCVGGGGGGLSAVSCGASGIFSSCLAPVANSDRAAPFATCRRTRRKKPALGLKQ